MKTLSALLVLGFSAALAAQPGAAVRQSRPVLIRDATVHTVSSAGTLQHTDLLLDGGKIAALGHALRAPPEAEIIEAGGRAVTPGLFGGIGQVGVEEIGEEPTVDDYSLRLGSLRPEFDVSAAFNSDSVVLGISRLGGITFTLVAPIAEASGKGPGGTIIAGQGAIARLDGTIAPTAHALFVEFGGGAAALAGGSRAAQVMLLQQAFTEVRSPKAFLQGDTRILTPGGRQALQTYTEGSAPIVFAADRASDIRQIINLARLEKVRAVILGGAEAWRVAAELAAARIPVVLNPLNDLPATFDSVGATLENAARLQTAGVKIAFTLDGADEPHNIRKVRQAAGIAVAHGLPWEAALAALTRNPAEIFGVAAGNGTLEKGRPADLVLWSGDPLEVTTLADRVFIQGTSQEMRSRQTLLRDRYLMKLRANAAR
jgi:imidazolonepropionase-like amidohydrolase